MISFGKSAVLKSTAGRIDFLPADVFVFVGFRNVDYTPKKTT